MLPPGAALNGIKPGEACIGVERTVKVLKEDAARACHSTNPFDFGLADLDMNDVTEIWETLKSEGMRMQYGKVFEICRKIYKCCQF